MADSKIDWTDKSWNPTTGCSLSCNYCYAEKMAYRLQKMGQEKYRLAFVPTCHPGELEKPLRWKKPAKIFVNSMGDLFDSAIPFEFIDRIMLVINQCQQHSFQILTKQPERMREYFQGLAATGTDTETSRRMLQNPNYASHGFHSMRLRYLKGGSLPNLWLGVTVENQSTADERLPLLLGTPAAVRFISIEPMLGPVDLPKIKRTLLKKVNHFPGFESAGDGGYSLGLDWVICGGMTGKDATPLHPEWVRSLRDKCQAAGVPFFFKQWGEWLPQCNNPFQPKEYIFLNHSGEIDLTGDHAVTNQGWTGVGRVGKKAAGALIDGKEWKQFPWHHNTVKGVNI